MTDLSNTPERDDFVNPDEVDSLERGAAKAVPAVPAAPVEPQPKPEVLEPKSIQTDSGFTVPAPGTFKPYQFTPESFSEFLGAVSMPDAAAGVVDHLQGFSTPGLSFDYESLRDGSSSWLKEYGPALVEGYQPGQGLNNEQILGVFTNARQYTPNAQFGQLAPMFDAAAETIPEAVTGTAAFGYGFKYGYRATPGPWYARALGGLALGTATGYAGGELGERGGELIWGPKYVYLPKDQSMAVAGETITYGLSGIPLLRMFPKDAANLAATRLLSQYNQVREAGAAGTEAARLEAKLLAERFGVSPKMFERAEAGKKAPLNVRIGSTIEGGAASARRSLTDSPVSTLALETATALSSGGGAFLANEIAPGEAVPRLVGEFTGAIVPITAIRLGATAARATGQGLKSGWSFITDPAYRERIKEGGLRAAQRRMGLSPQNASRVYKAFELAASKFPDSPDLSDEAQFDLFLKALGENLVDENGEPLQLGNLSEVGQEAVLKQLEGSSPKLVVDPETGQPAKPQPSAAVRLAVAGKPGARALGAVQEALDNLSAAFESQGKNASSAWLKGAQQYINGARFDGSPEALRDAARIATKVLEMDMSRQINDEIGKLVAAAERVTGGELTESAAVHLSEKLFEVVSNIAQKTRALEKQLWNEVDMDVPVTQFFNNAGEKIDLPNVLVALDTPLNDDGAKAATNSVQDQILAVLGKGFVEDMENFRAAATGTTPTTPRANVKVTNRFVEGLKNAEGTRGLAAYEKMRTDLGITDEISEGNIALLADAEERILRGAKYRSPAENKGHNEASRLFKLARESMIAQKSGAGQAVPAQMQAPPITYAHLQELRSHVLTKISELEQTNRRGSGPTLKALRSIERALLSDLLNNPDTGNEPYNLARAFTKAKSDAFAQSVLSDLYASVGPEGSSMDPSALIGYISGTGNVSDVRNIRTLQRLSEWVKSPLAEIGEDRNIVQGIVDSTVIPDAAADSKSLTDSTTDIIRNTFLRVVDMKTITDPATGEALTYPVVNPSKLAAFNKSPAAQQIFEIFPGLKADLENADVAQASVAAMGDLTAPLKTDPVMKAMSEIIGAESPEIAIGTAVNSKKPLDSLDRLLTTLTQGVHRSGDGLMVYPDEIREGLRLAVLNYAAQKAGGTGELMQPGNARRLYSILFDRIPRSEGKTSLGGWMLRNDIITKEHLAALKGNLQDFMDVEDAANKGVDALQDALTTPVSGSKLAAARIFGAIGGSVALSRVMNVLRSMGLAPSNSMGASLVAGSAGSEQMQNLLIRVPEALRVKLQAEYMNDPSLLGRMLIVGRNRAQNESIAARLQKFLTGKGLRMGQQRVPYMLRETRDDTVPPKKYVPEQQQSKPAPQQTPIPQRPAPQQTPIPQRPAPTPIPQSPAPQQTPIPQSPAQTPVPPSISGQANPQQRQQYAALFPNDSASGMIRQQGGIGSLL